MKKTLLLLLAAVIMGPAVMAQDATHWKGLGLGIYIHPKGQCYESEAGKWLFRCEDDGGMADKDGDGVADAKDNCPDVAGAVGNNGCPWDENNFLLESDAVKLKNIASHIYFESGKSIIKEESKPELDNLIAILKRNPQVSVDIEGHTDNTGDAEMNLQLSKERAAAVKQYLQDGGVESNHLDSHGYGETQPIGSNDTKAGRAKNRRVVLKTSFFKGN